MHVRYSTRGQDGPFSKEIKLGANTLNELHSNSDGNVYLQYGDDNLLVKQYRMITDMEEINQ